MKHNFLKTAFLLALISSSVSAQSLSTDVNRKCAPRLRQFLLERGLQSSEIFSRGLWNAKQADGVPLVIYFTNYEETASKLEQMGYRPRKITSTVLTVTLPADAIENVAALPTVERITGMERRYLHLDQSRAASNVDAAHAGTDLDTPYTGKGVTIGVIDQGFLYTHPAFRVTTDSTRITGVWNVSGNTGTLPTTGSSAILSLGEDRIDEAHGTHVAGIAAGGKTGSTTYYGMAPDAHIVMVSSSNFTNAEIVTGLDFIKQMAGQYNEPWVVNMSFGSNYGSHDGSDDLSVLLDSVFAGGGIGVCSAGNDGDTYIHASYEFSAGKDTCLIVVNDNSATGLFLYVIGDDATAFTVTPVFINTTNGRYYRMSTKNLQRVGNEFDRGINSRNNRYCYQALMPIATTLNRVGTGYIPAFLVKGKAGHRIDAFLDGNGPVFTSVSGKVCAPYDSLMTIGSPADAHTVIAVGAYNTRMTWRTIDNHTAGYTAQEALGALASFSSKGPSTDATLLKPTVCAPGFGVGSSVKYTSDYSGSTTSVLEKNTYNGTDYYYGIMQGTSQAAPAVTGIIALWLQANPDLTQADIMDILKNSSKTDNYTGETWNPLWGYGKIDAYNGLKLALQKVTGINRTVNSETPLTIKKSDTQWQLLFGSDESKVSIRLCSVDGKTVMARTLTGVITGQEETVSLTGYTPGIYILKIQTPRSTTARKVYIK